MLNHSLMKISSPLILKVNFCSAHKVENEYEKMKSKNIEEL